MPGSIGHSPSHGLCHDSPLSEGAKGRCYILVPTAPHPSALTGSHLPPGEGYFAHRREAFLYFPHQVPRRAFRLFTLPFSLFSLPLNKTTRKPPVLAGTGGFLQKGIRKKRGRKEDLRSEGRRLTASADLLIIE